jgi:hypothetical protein
MVAEKNIQVEQQRDLGKAFREIADLRGDLKELKTAVVGIDGNNGLRGELKEFMRVLDVRLDVQDDKLGEIADAQSESGSWKQSMESRLNNYMLFERAATCHGKSALDHYLAGLHKENVELKKQRMQGIIAIVTSILGVGGTIAGILITKL